MTIIDSAMQRSADSIIYLSVIHGQSVSLFLWKTSLECDSTTWYCGYRRGVGGLPGVCTLGVLCGWADDGVAGLERTLFCLIEKKGWFTKD